MKRTGKYISVCLCAVMIASMFMCGGCQKQEKTKITKKKQIELWHYWDIPGNQQHLEELVDQFNQSQDKIEVKVSYIPDEDFKKQLALSMSEEKNAGYCVGGFFGFSISPSDETICRSDR